MAIVAADTFINDLAGNARTLLNKPGSFRLFKNNFTPVPGDVIGAFTEADYTGYSAQANSSAFGAQSQISSGVYQTATGIFVWTCTGATSNTIYGWYLTESIGNTVQLSERFATPISMTNGVAFSLIVRYQEWAKILL